jgi:RNA polymerase sigma-70 factor (ECF subfamily)
MQSGTILLYKCNWRANFNSTTFLFPVHILKRLILLHEAASYSNADGEINAWLVRISAGDEDAFSQLLKRFWNKVYTQALAYLKSAAIAQELTQDVFLRIWTNRSKLSEVDNFPGYLFIITKNEILTQLRKPSTHQVPPDETLEESLWKPDQQLQYKESYTILLNGIEQLPPTRKQVFKMSRHEGLSYDAIAARLNISRNGVKDHIVKALLFLRTYARLHSDEIPILMGLLISLVFR